MSKLNLDELIQQKLNQLEVPHKPEYWTQMEEELETAAPISIGGIGSSLSRIYTITGIATSVVVISIIGYFAFRNHSYDKNDMKMLTTSMDIKTTTSDAGNTLVKKQAKQYKTSKEKSIASELPTKVSNRKEKSNRKTNSESKIIASNSNIKTNPNNSNRPQTKLDNQSTKDGANIKARNVESSVIVADLITIDSSDNLFSYDPRSIIKNKFNRNNNVKEETNVNNDLIVIKPISKPTKNVFNRGLLYRLGIRK